MECSVDQVTQPVPSEVDVPKLPGRSGSDQWIDQGSWMLRFVPASELHIPPECEAKLKMDDEIAASIGIVMVNPRTSDNFSKDTAYIPRLTSYGDQTFPRFRWEFARLRMGEKVGRCVPLALADSSPPSDQIVALQVGQVLLRQQEALKKQDELAKKAAKKELSQKERERAEENRQREKLRKWEADHPPLPAVLYPVEKVSGFEDATLAFLCRGTDTVITALSFFGCRGVALSTSQLTMAVDRFQLNWIEIGAARCGQQPLRLIVAGSKKMNLCKALVGEVVVPPPSAPGLPLSWRQDLGFPRDRWWERTDYGTILYKLNIPPDYGEVVVTFGVRLDLKPVLTLEQQHGYLTMTVVGDSRVRPPRLYAGSYWIFPGCNKMRFKWYQESEFGVCDLARSEQQPDSVVPGK